MTRRTATTSPGGRLGLPVVYCLLVLTLLAIGVRQSVSHSSTFLQCTSTNMYCASTVCNKVSTLEAKVRLLEARLEEVARRLPHIDWPAQLPADFPWPCSTGGSSGVVNIDLRPGAVTIPAYCDQQSDGGGWLVFQRRERHGNYINFERNWEDYKEGFGSPDGEFWLGLEPLHLLLSSQPTKTFEFRIDVNIWSGQHVSTCQGFQVGDEASKYRLTATDCASNSLANFTTMGQQDGAAFSTIDQDNDDVARHCARDLHSGWWHKGNGCASFNANGAHSGRIWPGRTYWSLLGPDASIRSLEMKIRPYG